MKKIFPYLKEYRKECVLGPLFKLFEASLELAIPLIVASIVDIGIKNSDINYVVRMCILLLVIAVVGMAVSLTGQWFAAKASTGFSANLRLDLMKHVTAFSYKNIDDVGTATIITRMTSDINQVQNGVNLALRLLLRSPFVVLGSAVMAFTISADIGLIFLLVIPVLALIVFAVMAITMPRYKNAQKNLDGVTAMSRENLNGVRVIRAFRREDEEVAEFNNKTKILETIQSHTARISALLNPTTFIVVNTAIIALIYTGAIKVDGGILTQGAVLALYNYMGQILVELVKTADLIVVLTKATACADRIFDTMEITPEQTNGDKELDDISVEFKNVSLRYYEHSDYALSDISFKVSKGQTVGIIGGIASGKTSLINLISRFYDTTEGEVLLGGTNVNALNMDNLRAQIALVPQKSVLFAGDVKSNLKWGDENITEQEMRNTLAISQSLGFIDEKDGLDTKVSQGGKNFSGGQRQRLAIARALAKKANILILDDSMSALDYLTDSKLRTAIKNMENPPTTFIVSQRTASILNADIILVLDDGKLVGNGTHSQLLENCETYQEIYYSQFPKEASV